MRVNGDVSDKKVYILKSFVPFLLALFVSIVLVTIAERLNWSIDLSNNQSNTISNQTRQILNNLPEPIQVIAFIAPEDGRKQAIQQMFERYTRYKRDLTVRIVDPVTNSNLIKEFDIKKTGQIAIQYEDNSVLIDELSEQAITRALFKLSYKENKWVAFLQGHGENDPIGFDRADFGQFSSMLHKQGLKVSPLDLGFSKSIPENISILVLLPGSENYREDEMVAIRRYIDSGGALLWLMEYDKLNDTLKQFAFSLGIELQDGLIVNPKAKIADNKMPEFAIVRDLVDHVLTNDLAGAIVFPTATSLFWNNKNLWTNKGIASSSLHSWLERGDLSQRVQYNQTEDVIGPLDIAIAMERSLSILTDSALSASGETSDDVNSSIQPTLQIFDENGVKKLEVNPTQVKDAQPGLKQRIVVIGDSDFLSNAFLGLEANMQFSLRLVNWLLKEDAHVNIETAIAQDLEFKPSDVARWVIGLVPTVLLPISLFLIAVAIYFKRYRSTDHNSDSGSKI